MRDTVGRTRVRLRWLTAILIASALRATPACSTDLTVWAPAIFTPASGIADGAAFYKTAYARFERDNPGVHIRFEVIDGSTPGLQAILTASGAGNLPDAAVVDGNWVARLVGGGLLQSLAKDWPAADQADFHPLVLAAETLHGEPYAIMFQTGMRGLLYRPSQLAASGLPAFPTSWEALQASAASFRKQGVWPILLPGKPNNEGGAVHMLSLFWGLGGELVDERGAPILFEGRNADVLRRTFQLYRDLVVSGEMTAETASMDEGALRPFFYSGDALAIGQSSSTLRQLLDEQPQIRDDLAIASFPLPGGARPVSVLGGFSYAIMARAPERRALAWRFVAFMTRADTMGEANEVQGSLPVRRSIWETRPYFTATPIMRAFKALYDGPMRARPSVPIYPAISAALTAEVSKVIAGSVTPERAVENVRTAVLADYQRQQGR